EGVLAGRGRVSEPLPSVREVVGGQRLAIRVLEAIADGVRVSLAVGADLRLVLRRRGDRLTGLAVEGHRSLEALHVHAYLLNERRLLGVDVVGLGTHVGGGVAVGVGLVSSDGGW